MYGSFMFFHVHSIASLSLEHGTWGWRQASPCVWRLQIKAPLSGWTPNNGKLGAGYPSSVGYGTSFGYPKMAKWANIYQKIGWPTLVYWVFRSKRHGQRLVPKMGSTHFHTFVRLFSRWPWTPAQPWWWVHAMALQSYYAILAVVSGLAQWLPGDCRYPKDAPCSF